ncbi:MAG: YfhO family protein [Acidimicrobiia bacterium]|nr:YfhO family protein [Acidimicrobiia bacterium]
MHVSGAGTWIGNPDRLNGALRLLVFHVRGVLRGHLDAWNEHVMLGFDSLALPGTYPAPTMWLTAAVAGPDLLHAEGWVAIGQLVLVGVAALAFLRRLGAGAFEAVVGAGCYQLCGLTVLLISQYTSSAAILIVIPVALLLIGRSHEGRPAAVCLALAIALAAMVQFMALQSAAYVLLLVAAYALWRGWHARSPAAVLLTAAGGAAALVGTAPRWVGCLSALGRYSREPADGALRDFAATYEFQNIRPYEVLRWLDGAIFGVSPSDAARLQNNINLTEGFLLTTSAVVPLLLLAALPRFSGRWAGLVRERTHDTSFWCWVVASTVLVVVWKPLAHLVHVLFFGLDFTHTRVLLVGALPMYALVAIVLTRWNPPAGGRTFAAGLVAGVVAAVVVEVAAGSVPGGVPLARVGLFAEVSGRMTLRAESLARVAGTCAAGALLLCLVVVQRARRPPLAGAAHAALGSLILVQAFLAADGQVNARPGRMPATPFYLGDMYMAARHEFRLPTPRQIDELHDRVGPDRVAFVCDPDVAGGFCAGHLADTWQLRSADGYYGLGVPRRVRELPWGDAVGLRTVSFTRIDALPWPLLGLLNVGAALIVDRELLTNSTADGRPADVSRIRIVRNPAGAVPRAFFARSAVPVADAAEASARLFGGRVQRDVRRRSFVEGLPAAASYATDGGVVVSGRGDRLRFDLSGSLQSRLLVVNELHAPGWRAFADDREVPVLPANVVMRAVVVPEGVRRVEMVYEPFVRSSSARALRWAGWAVLLGCLWIARRMGQRRRLARPGTQVRDRAFS